MTLQKIIKQAEVLDAAAFAKFLDSNKIAYTILDCNIMDYNEDYFNITLDDYEDANILFSDGEYLN
jgi:hypothetical protein